MAKRKESRAAMLRRLKAQRRKAGIGEFRKKTRSRRTTRRASIRRRAPKRARRVAKKRRASRASGFGAGLQKPLMAGLVFAFIQPLVSQFLRRFNIGIQDELVLIIAAIIVRNVFKNRFVKLWADMAISISVAGLVKDVAGNLLPSQVNV